MHIYIHIYIYIYIFAYIYIYIHTYELQLIKLISYVGLVPKMDCIPTSMAFFVSMRFLTLPMCLADIAVTGHHPIASFSGGWLRSPICPMAVEHLP